MEASKKNYVGRPPRYKNKEEIEGLFQKYLEDCQGKIINKPDGSPLLDKWGRVVRDGAKPLTITGLAIALGFNSRQSLLNYQGKKEFVDTITHMKAYVEEYTERRLFDSDGTRGAQFSLKNNFKGWKDNPVEENTDVIDKLDEVLSKMTVADKIETTDIIEE